MNTNSENRTVFHTVRFAPDEAAEVVEHAQAVGLSVSALMRARVLGHALPRGAAPTLNLTAWRELAGTAANLNQLSHHLNHSALVTGRAEVDLAEVKNLVELVNEKLKKVRLQLIGAA